MSPSTWHNNQFWESEYTSEEVKEYWRKWLKDFTKRERALSAIDNTLK